MSHIFLVIQSLNPFEKFCLWALMIAINVSVAIWQLPIRVNFVNLEKGLIETDDTLHRWSIHFSPLPFL